MVNGSNDSFMFGDNVMVINSTVVPASKIQHQSQILNDHRTREDQANGIIEFVHINGNDNPADIVTKICPSNTWYPLANTILFWNDTEFIKDRVVAEGS